MANLEATFIAPDGFPTTAGALRALIAEMFADASGIRSGKLRGMSVAPAPPDAGFAVTVNEGSAIIPTDDGLGAYFVTQYAPETIPWIPAGGQPRVDSLVLAVADSDYGTIPASLGPIWRVVEGVAAPSPVALSDADLSAALGTPGGHLRWIDVEIPPAPQEAITGNLMTARYAEVSRALAVYDVSYGGSAVNATAIGWSPVTQWPTITAVVPSSGKLRVTVGAHLSSADTTYCYISYRISGAHVVEPNYDRSIMVALGSRGRATVTHTHTGLTPGASVTVTPYYWGSATTGNTLTHFRMQVEQLP